MTIQQHFEYFYERTYGVKPVFLVESKVYALHNQQIAYDCFCKGWMVGFETGFNSGWEGAINR